MKDIFLPGSSGCEKHGQLVLPSQCNPTAGAHRSSCDIGPTTPILEGDERGAIMADNVRGTSSRIDVREGLGYASSVTATLFFDRFEYPEIQLPFGTAQLPRWGVSGKLQVRPVKLEGDYRLDSVPYDCWRSREEVEPGRWSIWHHEDFDPLPDGEAEPNLGFRLKLENLLVVPHKAVDFERTIAFRERRRAELIALRTHIDELCVKVAERGDHPARIRLETYKFEKALNDYLAAVRGENWDKSVIDLSIGMDWADVARDISREWATAAGGAAAGGALLGLPVATIGGIIGSGLIGGLSLSMARGLKKRAKSPFSYVGRIVSDLNKF